MTTVAMIENVPAGSEGSTPAITFKGWGVRVEWLAIEKSKAEAIALNGLSSDEFEDLMSGAEGNIGFNSGEVFVDDQVVAKVKMKCRYCEEPTEIGDFERYYFEIGDRKTYFLVTEEVQSGSWKVEERTSQGFEKSKLSQSLFKIALNGHEIELNGHEYEGAAYDLKYDDRCFDNDSVESDFFDAYLIDPTGRKIGFDIGDTDPQPKLL